jgi:mannan endo-1,4-beta-mannosidase
VRVLKVMIAVVAILAAGTVAVRAGLQDKAKRPLPPRWHAVAKVLPARPESYLGVYAPPAPISYTGVASFARLTTLTPRIVMYFSGWGEQFRVKFAQSAARHGQVPLVQIDPTGVSLAAIAAGRYNSYLREYASEVIAYRAAVIISFGHEMNGDWYSWGNRHTSPADFRRAWQYIVTFFRKAGVLNVTWLWTANVVSTTPGRAIPSPFAWWPGQSYVTWVGIDGYYLQPSYRFSSLFGPTILAVRRFTKDPILISETGASGPQQPRNITDLAAGVRQYGLLGFVWFDAGKHQDWQITSRGAVNALRAAAGGYGKTGGQPF